MRATNGNLLTKILSGQYLNISISKTFEVILLTGFGMLAIFLHTRLRSPINIPGHHGFEFMFIFISGRILSKLPFASSFMGVGAGLLPLIPFLGFTDPFMGFHYMIPGVILDVLFRFFPRYRNDWLFYALIAGIAYMSIPLSRLAIRAFIFYPYGAFIKYGAAYTSASFFVFGLLGGITGSGVLRILKKI